tara:strand:+ start:392 stop:526 length:135 start_codon:yes stop_codon:yes gene_type:complete
MDVEKQENDAVEFIYDSSDIIPGCSHSYLKAFLIEKLESLVDMT